MCHFVGKEDIFSCWFQWIWSVLLLSGMWSLYFWCFLFYLWASHFKNVHLGATKCSTLPQAFLCWPGPTSWSEIKEKMEESFGSSYRFQAFSKVLVYSSSLLSLNLFYRNKLASAVDEWQYNYQYHFCESHNMFNSELWFVTLFPLCWCSLLSATVAKIY